MKIYPTNLYSFKNRNTSNQLITKPQSTSNAAVSYNQNFTANFPQHVLDGASDELIAALKKLSEGENYFKLLEGEKHGMTLYLPKGILVGGKSDVQKSLFVDAMKSAEDHRYLELKYNPKQSENFFSELTKIAAEARKNYMDTRQRTMLRISGIGKLLSGEDCEKFLKTAEDYSDSFHMTILGKTSRDLSSFSNSVKEFFGVKFTLNNAAKGSQKLETSLPKQVTPVSDLYILGLCGKANLPDYDFRSELMHGAYD